MRRSIAKASVVTALNLLFFALIGTAMLALTYELTHETIKRSEEAEKLKLITQIAAPSSFDNDIMKETVKLPADKLLGIDEFATAHIGRLKGRPSFAVLPFTAPDGYSGKINMIIAIHSDGQKNGKIGGVRVISHKETPGLGDYIEIAKNKWIAVFNGTSLDNLNDSDWQVKKDGGKFDYMTGATVTPRAIVKAVHKALQYFQKNQDEIFAPPTPAKMPVGPEVQVGKSAEKNIGEKK